MFLTMAKVVNKRFAEGKGEYAQVIKTIDQHGKCPFCPANFKYHKKPILKKYQSWILTENSWPYSNTDKHFIIISAQHKEQFSDLTSEDFLAVKYLANWAIKKFGIKGGALTIRFGDTNYTGATVCHLHFHLISPKLDKNGLSKTVTFPIG
ncbi:MAG: HIT domain-containing protein [Candidatus Vogelbacteria bacterium]|nr:HIT domain-containing protein [Candidatus Vogelbacteria bacterium]